MDVVRRAEWFVVGEVVEDLHRRVVTAGTVVAEQATDGLRNDKCLALVDVRAVDCRSKGYAVNISRIVAVDVHVSVGVKILSTVEIGPATRRHSAGSEVGHDTIGASDLVEITVGGHTPDEAGVRRQGGESEIEYCARYGRYDAVQQFEVGRTGGIDIDAVDYATAGVFAYVQFAVEYISGGIAALG